MPECTHVIIFLCQDTLMSGDTNFKMNSCKYMLWCYFNMNIISLGYSLFGINPVQIYLCQD